MPEPCDICGVVLDWNTVEAPGVLLSSRFGDVKEAHRSDRRCIVEIAMGGEDHVVDVIVYLLWNRLECRLQSDIGVGHDDTLVLNTLSDACCHVGVVLREER